MLAAVDAIPNEDNLAPVTGFLDRALAEIELR
jgi:hypothetical protein